MSQLSITLLRLGFLVLLWLLVLSSIGVLRADLYGTRVRLAFVQRLRGEQAFAGVDALVRQIREDAAAARSVFERFSL